MDTLSPMLRGHTQQACAMEVVSLPQMESVETAYIHTLKACSDIHDLQQAHMLIIERGLESCMSVGSTLVRMYATCMDIQDACIVFERLGKHNVVTWNVLMSGLVQHDKYLEVFEIFKEMQERSIKPSSVTCVYLLKACSNMLALEVGMQVHNEVVACGLDANLFVANSLIDLYMSCGIFEDALCIFQSLPNPDVVTWNTIISGYIEHGLAPEALKAFQKMQQGFIHPNEVTFVCALQACSSTVTLEQGKYIHSLIIDRGLSSGQHVRNTLIDMYAKCGSLVDAYNLFKDVPKKDVVTWNVLVDGYSQNGYCHEALQLFQQMLQEGMKPNKVTLTTVLKACSSIAALGHGQQIHLQIQVGGLESDAYIVSALIDMYTKCGQLTDASMLFQRLSERDVVTWTAMIAGCAQYSDYPLASQYFEDMKIANVKPNEVTYHFMLLACSHTGLVCEGCSHLKSMREEHSITPSREHYSPMVDLLSHAGLWDEAEDLLETLAYSSGVDDWVSLLMSCRTHEKVGLAQRCYEHICLMQEDISSTGCVLMVDVYSNAGRHGEAEELSSFKRRANIWKKAAKASIESNNQVHMFTVGDKTHAKSDDIYARLRALHTEMKMKDKDNPLCM